MKPLAAPLGIVAMLALVGLPPSGVQGAPDGAEAHIAFQIATGISGGPYFSVGQAIAGLISNPPGVNRCETANVCGPTGLIISARTSDGGIDNLRQVEIGAVDSGLAQDDTIRAAADGKDSFARRGKVTHLRAIAVLFPEDVHLVVATKSKIAKVSDLKGKRVSLGTGDSGTGVAAREILDAWQIPEWHLHAVHQSNDADVAMMREGKLDAFFVVGGVADPIVSDIVGHGLARLVPIDGAGRKRLVRESPGLAPAVIPAGTYANTGAVETVSTRAVWVVRDSEPDALIYGITRALFGPANRATLASGFPSGRAPVLESAMLDLPVPLHPGAARYYREMGKLPKTN